MNKTDQDKSTDVDQVSATSVDQWAAEKCGVEIFESSFEQYQPNVWIHNGVKHTGKWTLDDERCLKVFREWWLKADSANISVNHTADGCVYVSAVRGSLVRPTEHECIEALRELEVG